MPHIKADYFQQTPDRSIFKMIQEHAEKYKRRATREVLRVGLEEITGISEHDYTQIKDIIESLNSNPSDDLSWLVDTTESFCLQQSSYNGLAKALEIQENAAKPLEEQNKRLPSLGMIPDILRDATSVCFDTSVGHEYFKDWEPRYQSYIEKAAKVPFKMNILNKITQGGVERSTLNLILAGSNVGKSLALCHLATEYLQQGYNVLYISMEMSEEAVAKRIDANMLDISMDDFETLTKKSYGNRINSIEQKTQGKLFIKQYPTAGANANHFSALMNELKMKKEVVPDVVIVDYLGICASSRVSNAENTYVHVKAVAEEVRGFAVEHDIVCWSAAQTTRSAWDASSIGMSDVAESAGLVHTADFILGVTETEETAQMNQQFVNQIKSRYGDKNINASFMIAVQKSKQRWGDVDGTASFDVNVNTPTKAATKSASPFVDKLTEADTSDVNW